MTIRPMLAAAFVLLATPALANQCPSLMAEVDAALESSSLSAAEAEQVRALRDEGEQLHAAGDHAASVEKLNEAKAMLGL